MKERTLVPAIKNKISEAYNVPYLYKIENEGTEQDIIAIQKILTEF